jgi:prepilin-type N-terminal cleavage/methylation domain-containing protein
MQRTAKSSQAGFTLIELIAVVVLTAIVAGLSIMSISTAIQGYIIAQGNTLTSLDAQVALDRMSMELRDINLIDVGTPVAGTKNTITYRHSTLTPGQTRIMRCNTNFDRIEISPNNGTDYFILIDDAPCNNLFTIPALQDMDGDGTANEIEFISVDFDRQIATYNTPFNARIRPRGFLSSTNSGSW